MGHAELCGFSAGRSAWSIEWRLHAFLASLDNLTLLLSHVQTTLELGAHSWVLGLEAW